MFITLNVSTLNGTTKSFENIPYNMTIKNLKNQIYNNHPGIDKCFNNIKDLDIDLIYQGTKLEDHIIINDLDIDNSKNLIINIKSKSKIINKKKTIVNDYMVSPCSNTDEEIFMDTFDTFEYDNKSQNLTLNDINKNLNQILDLFKEVVNKLDDLNIKK